MTRLSSPAWLSKLSRSNYWREADAKRILECWTSSDLSLSAFAEREGLKPGRLYRWRGRLRAPAAVATAFKEISLPRESRAPFELVLRSGLVLRIGNGFDDGALRRLVSVFDQDALSC